ncbi:LLM class F420-dependent oxidoreductase [Nocardia sp. NBC_00565]|uniref:LLM class F420-dependent oxidoreductase n=1 Tax=Nocardia sp. NBC_00565 TaxID=2975993 RepID=UPI002E8058B9|nr:LLM class F420-dependent oxidoreductase [Nocardia sp. NBC_00565]WUC04048.1 LLM class F420-dependent oxidoreductase [Nocardia sp. NBC_00565]
MRLSISLADFTWPDSPDGIGVRVDRIVRAADQAGLDSVFVMDHLFQIGSNGPPEHDMLEAYAALGYIAGRTERIRLGALVTAVSYRDPGLLVKSVTTLDVLSGGRAWLGIGAAWNADESAGLGLFFPPTSQRYERLEETLRIARQMWEGSEKPFHGKHYTLTRPLNVPNSLTRPHPPIMIGGQGERKTLRLVAQYADACNLFGPSVDIVAAKLAVLRGHCEAVARPYDEIEKTMVAYFYPDKSVAEQVDSFGRFAEVGIEHIVLGRPGPFVVEDFEKLAELVLAVR